MNVLLVDDDPDIRLILEVVLTQAGYTVDLVTNGQEALDHLTAVRELPCVILVDLIMPTMDGWEFLARQRADARLAPIPVVILSVGVPPQADLQVAGVLTKPIDFGAVLAAVAHCCAGDH